MPRVSPVARRPPRVPLRWWRSPLADSQPPTRSSCSDACPSRLSADSLIALQRRGEAAILLGRIALQQFFLGDHGIVVAAIGERTDHGAARAFACPFNKSAQFVLARNEHFTARREIIAVVKRVAAGIHKQGA